MGQGQLQQVGHHAGYSLAIDAVVVFELFGGVINGLQKALAGLLLGYFLHLGVGHLGPAVEHGGFTEHDVLLVVLDNFLQVVHTLEPHQLQLPAGINHLSHHALFMALANHLAAPQNALHLHVRQVVVQVYNVVELGAVEVTEGVALNQVAIGKQAQLLLQQLGALQAHALQVFNLGLKKTHYRSC